MRVLVWFSCGAASAVAAKLSKEKYGADCDVVYCDTSASEHRDNRRFLRDVQKWVGHEFRIIRSTKYETIDDVFARERYMAGVAGAKCTVEMKKVPREAFQRESDTHVFGYTAEEELRAQRFEKWNPSLAVEWILIDQGVTKTECLRRLKAADIAIPEMYRLGFDHNNCIGCVKSQSPGYWNKVRRLFPDVFDLRVLQSRMLGVKLAKVRGERVFLDEIPGDDATPDDDIDCGPVCQTPTQADLFGAA
jgi:hypothetical protein